MKHPVTAPLLALVLLAGCAGGSRVPSLQPRPIERIDDLEPVTRAPVATPDPALDAQLARLGADLDTADKAFEASSSAAASAVAAANGAAVGSDAWLNAQKALNDVTNARSNSIAVAADIDKVALARAQQGLPDYPAIKTLTDRAEAQVDRQTKALDRWKAALAQP